MRDPAFFAHSDTGGRRSTVDGTDPIDGFELYYTPVGWRLVDTPSLVRYRLRDEWPGEPDPSLQSVDKTHPSIHPSIHVLESQLKSLTL